jgi:hypothetical protein
LNHLRSVCILLMDFTENTPALAIVHFLEPLEVTEVAMGCHPVGLQLIMN